MRAQLVGITSYIAPEIDGQKWYPDAGGGQAVAELAGRACYQSWSRPREATATNAGYLAHILETGHFSVLEHGTASFYFTGISRSCTHELIRHRHFSYSQLSQRFVPAAEAFEQPVIPPLFEASAEAQEVLQRANLAAHDAYEDLMSIAEDLIPAEVTGTARRKRAREASRAALLNATETQIVVTGNYRAWRHFIALRASEHADAEIRELAVMVLGSLRNVAGNVFSDFVLAQLDDGSWTASSPYAERS